MMGNILEIGVRSVEACEGNLPFKGITKRCSRVVINNCIFFHESVQINWSFDIKFFLRIPHRGEMSTGVLEKILGCLPPSAFWHPNFYNWKWWLARNARGEEIRGEERTVKKCFKWDTFNQFNQFFYFLKGGLRAFRRLFVFMLKWRIVRLLLFLLYSRKHLRIIQKRACTRDEKRLDFQRPGLLWSGLRNHR